MQRIGWSQLVRQHTDYLKAIPLDLFGFSQQFQYSVVVKQYRNTVHVSPVSSYSNAVNPINVFVF
jgi:hypothetical protein